jgi:hypothetical protein
MAMVVAGFLATAPAYGQNTSWELHPPPLFPTNAWGAVNNDCQLSLRVPKFQYSIGERLVVFLTMRNIGDKPLAYLYTDKYIDYEVLVKRVNGQSVSHSDWWAGAKDHLQPFSSHDVGLPPHQQQEYLHWMDVTELYKMDAMGAYAITVRQKLHLEEIISESPLHFKRIGTFDILSNPVIITIAAPKSEK